jgi:hypothetical protein
MEAKLAGYCATNWRWGEIEPHSIVDVGDVELVRGGSIRGRIVDSRGRALTKDWTVYAEGVTRDHSGGRDETRVIRAPSPENGEYVLGATPARSREAVGKLPPRELDRRADRRCARGRGDEGDIPYTDRTMTRASWSSRFCRPFHIFDGIPREILLRAPDSRTQGDEGPRLNQSFSFEDVLPRRYTVEVRDPRFQPWSKDGVEPGTSVDAKLKGNASVVLTVVDDRRANPCRTTRSTCASTE